MSNHTTTGSLLNLPPEIRKEIYLLYFRSLIIELYTPPRQDKRPDVYETPLALLESCRQIYLEAEPLVLPNVCFALRTNVEQLQEGATDATDHGLHEGRDLNAIILSSSPYDKQIIESLRYFHLGAILELFPGLQLDILQVVGGVEADSYTRHQNTDCFVSLLEADGYRRIWMQATGDEPLWAGTQFTKTWGHTIATKFKPRAGWKVKIKLDGQDWKYREHAFWREKQDTGITVAGKGPSDPPSEVWSYGYENEDAADIVIDRGDGDVAVKLNDSRVLRCIQRSYGEETAEYYKEASDDLRYLFNTCSWKAIKDMDGYMDGWW